MRRMRNRLFEDFLLNKLNGYYLILYGNNRRFLAELVFRFGRVVVSFMIFIRLIPPRIIPCYASVSKKENSAASTTNDIERIREIAYHLWAEKGCPENSDLDNWLEAERQLCLASF